MLGREDVDSLTLLSIPFSLAHSLVLFSCPLPASFWPLSLALISNSYCYLSGSWGWDGSEPSLFPITTPAQMQEAELAQLPGVTDASCHPSQPF